MARNRTIKEQIDPWLYLGKPIESLEQMPDNTFGFVYLITSKNNGKKYVGKKAVKSIRYKIEYVEGKRPGRKRKVKVPVISEAKWQDYFGSGKEILEAVKAEGKKSFVREILRFVPTKKLLTYYELKEQCDRNVLEVDDYYNDNILAKFYRRDFINDDVEKSSEEEERD